MRRHNKGFTIGELLVVFCIVSLAVLLLQPFVRHVRGRSDKVKCANNLRATGNALYVYARANQGKFPKTLKALYREQYLADEKFMNCPADRHEGTPDKPDYDYFPGLSVLSPRGTILVEDKRGNHPGAGRNVLYVNGEIMWKQESR